MGHYEATVRVDVPIERAFEVLTDATRFPQWQAAALRAVDQSAPLDPPGSSVRIDHGPRMVRTMTVLVVARPWSTRSRHTGRGFDDGTTVNLRADGATTIVTMSADLRVAGGAIGRMLERVSRGSTDKEVQAELDRFAAVARRTVAFPDVAALVTVDSGAGFRLVKVLAVDDDVIHLALFPGTDRERPTDPRRALERPAPTIDPISPRPLDISVRNSASKIVPGSPFLRLDGGAGVPHLAVTRDAYADMRPETLPERLGAWAIEQREIDTWRGAAGPVLGRDLDAGLAPLLSVRVDGSFGVIKVLRTEGQVVHLRMYSDRWEARPYDIDPWALRLGRADEPVPGIGHMPITRSAMGPWEPKLERLVMVGPDELEGYRMWRDTHGGVFG